MLWIERMLDPSARKIVPGTNRRRTPVGKLLHSFQRMKSNYNVVVWRITCNVDLYLDLFNNFHGVDTYDYLEYTKKSLIILLAANHLISTVFLWLINNWVSFMKSLPLFPHALYGVHYIIRPFTSHIFFVSGALSTMLFFKITLRT